MAITVAAHKLAFMALPKAGCTSVKRALAQVDPEVTQADTPDVDTWHRVYQTRRFHEKRWAAVADHWKFCVVRDPIKRLMSCYSDLVAKRDLLEHSKQLRRYKHLTTQPDPDYFFTHFDAYAHASSVVKHHVLPAFIFLGPELKAHYDRVYRTDEMDQLGRDLSRRTGTLVRIPHSNKTTRNLQIDDLLDETIDILRPFLDAEYAYFRGFFRNPLGPRIHAVAGRA